MIEYFRIIYSSEFELFLEQIDPKAKNKIIYNMDKAKKTNDIKLFKKLDSEIWAFRTKFKLKQYRILAFWDKTNSLETLVITTHGFIKKSKKIPKHEIIKAKQIMDIYFKNIDKWNQKK